MKNYNYEEMRKWLCGMVKNNGDNMACPHEMNPAFNCSAHNCRDCADLVLDEYERLVLLKNGKAVMPKKETLKRNYTAEKKAWVKKVNGEFEDTNRSWRLDSRNGQIIVYKVGQSGVVKTGMARCNPSDTFDMATGCALAYARAQGYEIPFYMFL